MCQSRHTSRPPDATLTPRIPSVWLQDGIRQDVHRRSCAACEGSHCGQVRNSYLDLRSLVTHNCSPFQRTRPPRRTMMLHFRGSPHSPSCALLTFGSTFSVRILSMGHTCWEDRRNRPPYCHCSSQQHRLPPPYHIRRRGRRGSSHTGVCCREGPRSRSTRCGRARRHGK